MKKYIALALSVMMFASNVYGQITTNYINDSFDTTQDHYSISGSSDPDYPLYINGEAVNRTESGYFSYYAPLNTGENKFVLENTSDSKTITINKKATSTGSGEATEDVFVEKDLVGVVNRNHPTVRSRPDEADDDLIGPYVKDTLVHITGENSEYYRTVNGVYLYTDSVEITNDTYGENKVKDVSSSGTAVSVKMDRSTEYKCDLTSDGFKLTLYDTDAIDDVINVDDGIVESITKESSSPAVYNIKFKEKNRVVGYMSYFNDGVYKVEFNERNILTDKNLNGVKVVLDAGHGGSEGGTPGLGAIGEKDITLAITNYLGDYLKAKGANVVYTRTDDSDVALTTRMARIIEEKPDVSVSIHCNSMNAWNDFNNYSGTLHLYTYDMPTDFIESLAKSITGSTYRKQNLALTRTSICPAVLIETGFISNPVEYEYFSKAENQKAMAEKIGAALEDYFYGINGLTVESTTEATSETTTEIATEATTEETTEETTAETTTVTTTETYSETTTATAETSSETTTVVTSGTSHAGGGKSSSGRGSSSKTTTETTTEATTEETTEKTTKTTTETTTESTTAALSDISGHYAESYITKAFERGFVSGYNDGTFKPNNSVTRAEFIKILYTIFGDNTSTDISFADISGAEWYCQYVKWGVAKGLINGYSDNTFRANNQITREEAAVILSKCANLNEVGETVEIKDTANISAWAKDSVDKVSKAGIMQGDTNGYFNPKKSLTRAETAVLAIRIS